VFVLQDLFAAGIALDFIGAVLVAKGLLLSHGAIVVRAGTYWGGNPGTLVGAMEDRVDGQFGIAYLALGFAVQLAGYLLVLGLEPGATGSWERAAGALIVAIVIGLAAGLAWRLRRTARMRATLVEIAHWAPVENALAAPTRHPTPHSGFLQESASAAGVAAWKALPDESPSDYAERVFGLREVR
jgi:hypothetical protein